MNHLIVLLVSFSTLATVLSEKEIVPVEEVIKPEIEVATENNDTISNVTTTLDVDTTIETNKSTIITLHEDLKVENSTLLPENATIVINTAVMNGRRTENITVLPKDDFKLEEKKHEQNETKYPPKDYGDEIEDYDDALMPNIPKAKNLDPEDTAAGAINDHNVDVERQIDDHQNVLNITRRNGNEDYGDIKKVLDHKNGTGIETLIEPKHMKNASTGKESQTESIDDVGKFLALVNNDTANFQNDDNKEAQLRIASDKDLSASIEDLVMEDIYDENPRTLLNNNRLITISNSDEQPINENLEHHQSDIESLQNIINDHPNILLDLKYRSGDADHNNEDQEAVANITPAMITLPTSQPFSSSETIAEGDKSIDDYSNQLSSNAYTFSPLKVNKKEKKPEHDNHNEKMSAPEHLEFKDINNKKTRRFYDDMYTQHPVYLPRNIELSSTDSWKTGFNYEFKELPNTALVNQDSNTYRYEHFPSYLNSKFTPDFSYRTNFLRLRADHVPDSVNTLVSNLNHMLSQPASYSNEPKENHLNLSPRTQDIYKHVSRPLFHDITYPHTGPDNLPKHDKPHLHRTNFQNDERQIQQQQANQNFNNLNTFSGMLSRLRDGNRSGLHNNLNLLIAPQRQPRRRRRRFCYKTHRNNAVRKRRLILSRLLPNINH